MLNTLILIFVLLANVVAILLVYYSFGKGMDKNKKFMGTMITIGLMYIIVLVVYDLSTIGIGKNNGSEMAKTLMTMSFVPVNVIIFAPFMIYSYLKTKKGDLPLEKLNRRVIVMGILAIIVLVSEFFYFRSFQNKVKNMQQQLQQNTENTVQSNIENTTSNNETENITNNTNEVSNDILDTNETNQVIANNTTNTINTVK